jgi:hypothetical protein
MEDRTGSIVDPATMRTVLKNTGSPQQAGNYPISQNIGPMPNLRAALEESQEIPTLSEWGMLILALLLLAIGSVAVVKKRKAAISRAA